jgi:hypothetical protein
MAVARAHRLQASQAEHGRLVGAFVADATVVPDRRGDGWGAARSTRLQLAPAGAAPQDRVSRVDWQKRPIVFAALPLTSKAILQSVLHRLLLQKMLKRFSAQ